MDLQILGYYGGYPREDGGTSAYLITSGDYHLLMDIGSGALMALEKIMPPAQLDAVLLTHYHHDHTADLGVLQYYWQLTQDTKKHDVLPIYGHTKDPLNYAALTFEPFTKGFGYTADTTLDLGPLTLTFMETQHPVPAFAVRVTEKATGKTIVNTSDTRYFSDLARFATGADLLMADTNFLADQPAPRWHLTAPEAGTLANAANVNQLLLTHLPHADQALLLQQAQASAGDVPVVLAKNNLRLSI